MQNAKCRVIVSSTCNCSFKNAIMQNMQNMQMRKTFKCKENKIGKYGKKQQMQDDDVVHLLL